MESGPNRLVASVRRNPALRDLVYRLGRRRASVIVRWLRPCLERGDRILDVGAGTGNVTELLRRRGWDTTPLDVEDLTFTRDVVPVIYDGTRMPFEDRFFDVALISTVLHHVSDADAIIGEAARVARRVIIVEDVVSGFGNRYATYALDSLLTLEFVGHPHSNRTDDEWRGTFTRLGLRLTRAEYQSSMLVLRHALYCLDAGDSPPR